LAVFVVTWVNPPAARQGAWGCGVFTVWHWKQSTPEPPPEKSVPWQIRQEANPELPGAALAEAPCCAGSAQFDIVP
jgi:hypothetical protein